jgi:hypothetical protein
MVWVNMGSVGEILNYEDKAYDKICLTTIKEDEVITTVLVTVPIFGLWAGRGCSALWPCRGRTHGLAIGLSTRSPRTVQKYNNIKVTQRIFLTLTI